MLSRPNYLLIARLEIIPIHTFYKGIRAVQNINNIIQDLNSDRRVYFQRQ